MSDLPRCKNCSSHVGQPHQSGCHTAGQGDYDVTWDEAKFDPLDLKTPAAHVDAFIRASGGDPVRMGEDGQALAMALITARKVTLSEWAALIPLMQALKQLGSHEGRRQFVQEGPRAFARIYNHFTRLPDSVRALADLKPMP